MIEESIHITENHWYNRSIAHLYDCIQQTKEMYFIDDELLSAELLPDRLLYSFDNETQREHILHHMQEIVARKINDLLIRPSAHRIEGVTYLPNGIADPKQKIVTWNEKGEQKEKVLFIHPSCCLLHVYHLVRYLQLSRFDA